MHLVSHKVQAAFPIVIFLSYFVINDYLFAAAAPSVPAPGNLVPGN